MENQYPKYLFEKDRLASFKQWPFPESVACNVQSVNTQTLCLEEYLITSCICFPRWQKPASIGMATAKRLTPRPVLFAGKCWTAGKRMTILGRSTENTHHSVFLWRTARKNPSTLWPSSTRFSAVWSRRPRKTTRSNACGTRTNSKSSEKPYLTHRKKTGSNSCESKSMAT